jgi:arylformamidase
VGGARTAFNNGLVTASEYRAQFDASVTFSNGGGLRAEGFRVDVPGPDVTEREVAGLFAASLNLLMVDAVDLSNLSVFPEQHKGTRGGPSDRAAAPESGQRRIVDLTHPIRHGMLTHPGLPGPEMRPHMTRAASRDRYEPGTEFQIDAITMVGNTGTYLDSPFHRYADGLDLAALPLESCVGLPAVVVRTAGSGTRAVDTGALAALAVAGRAVLLHTGGDAAWGSAGYATDAPYLTEAGARWLAGHGASLVGIDSVNIDDIQGGGARPAHSILLRAGIVVVEHLTGLGQLPPTGFQFTAAPIPVAGFSTFPVRAYASVPQPA